MLSSSPEMHVKASEYLKGRKTQSTSLAALYDTVKINWSFKYIINGILAVYLSYIKYLPYWNQESFLSVKISVCSTSIDSIIEAPKQTDIFHNIYHKIKL